jgi:phosphosulfolactate synthase
VSIETAFASVALPERGGKPRNQGLTMMIDWGLPVAHQRDVTDTVGHYVDMAKIAATIAGLMPKEILQRKLASYAEAGICTSPGGLFAEYAYSKGNLDPFFQEAAELGFSAVEISDNLLNWNLETKRETIRKAIDNYGLAVLGEVGRKDAAMSNDDVLRDIAVCFDAGASSVYVEAYELFAGEKIRDDLVTEIAKNFAGMKIIYELPVVVLPGISREFKHRVCSWMVAEFGSDVNLANVEWDEVWMTEMLRRRLADNLDVEA